MVLTDSGADVLVVAAMAAAVDDEHDDGMGSMSLSSVNVSKFLVEAASALTGTEEELSVIDGLSVAAASIVMVFVAEHSDMKPTVIIVLSIERDLLLYF